MRKKAEPFLGLPQRARLSAQWVGVGAWVWLSQSDRQTCELHVRSFVDCQCHASSKTRGPGSNFSFKTGTLGM